ncbi:MAG: precorrin-3B C(17)-methyltransferase, partial [Planctomycetia bacterium]|nr:precorrin-3B C(17)-methyltransferase [Planctomycetia bacterium]
LLETKAPETVCGWVRNIGREGQTWAVTTLGALKDLEADMFYTLFIGSSATRRIGEHMVTPRGYAL